MGYHTKTRSFGQLIKEDDNVLRSNTCTDYEYSTTDRGKVESIASNSKKELKVAVKLKPRVIK